MNYLRIYTLIILFCLIAVNGFGQAINIISKLSLEKWSGQYNGEEMSVEKCIQMLDYLPSDERIEFIMDDGLLDDDIHYFELDTSGLIYLDLDFDGDLDLMYSSINAPMMQTATKVYYNTNNVLEHKITLRDGVLDIYKDQTSFRVFTLFRPCCDSYTTRIDEYLFSQYDTAKFQQSVSIIGRTYEPFKGMIDFNVGETFSDSNLTLLALQKDFRAVSPYFRELNKEVKTKLREKGVIELLQIKGEVNYRVIDSLLFKEEKFKLIITESLNNMPKMPFSLYEWSEGNNRRLIGWIRN